MKTFVFCFLSSYTTPILADFLGPSYPAPVDLSSNASLVLSSWRNVSTQLQKRVTDIDSAASWNNVTFSLGMFSLYDDEATTLQFHHTSPEIANSTYGTKSVDADSIYRIASVSKVFTVLAGLLNLNLTDWERPLTDLIAPLAKFTKELSGDNDFVNIVEWDKVTPNALAAQIAGVPRDGFVAPGELTYAYLAIDGLEGLQELIDLGFPPIADNDTQEYPPCFPYLINATTCPANPWVESVEGLTPTFRPWTTPAYSDAGFAMLGLAIASIARKSMDDIYRSEIFEPLGMSSSNSTTPPRSAWDHCVIPGNSTANFAIDAGVLVSTGGLLSTINDLARFSRAILNSTLLLPEDTRRWLKPFSHTAHLQYSVGRPWEIMRFTHPTTNKVTDLYTKFGDSGDYSGFLALVPDYQAGFNVLASSTSLTRSTVILEIADLVINTILPALEAQAAAEAEYSLGGLYTSTGPVNSSLSLVSNNSAGAAPGLHIKSWISNGTDLLQSGLLGPLPYRLVPSIEDVAGSKSAFWMVNANDAPNAESQAGRLASAPGFANADWVLVDSPAYGGNAVKRFVFDLADDGQAAAVSPTVFRIKLHRVNA
ncbi:hypothetical protein N0V93_000099 [Gnomoniopsis smithogilvyi]|uniref:Beta-lactamase-related domain-containing protein n=1 Tax=Gnomoniopsis smithogilvyi TaxID=1191159 RepID=A0A9W9D129_9PEZI|nr:hypothetical protein N0V93_000099 [Gnomoniopsis smithogilvyi]